MAGVRGAAGVLALMALVLVLTLNLGTAMTWLMISLGVLLGLFGLPILGLASRLRWRKERNR